MSGRRAVFLDRDGVLNAAVVIDGRPHPPRDVGALELLPRVEESCRRLGQAGLLLIGVTNQPDVARGEATSESVDAINGWLVERLGLTAMLTCPHDDAAGCDCRKPRPGLLLEAAQRWSVDLGSSVMVGDRWRDIEAGRRAGCRTVFVDHGWTERRPSAPDWVVASLGDAVEWILTASPAVKAGT